MPSPDGLRFSQLEDRNVQATAASAEKRGSDRMITINLLRRIEPNPASEMAQQQVLCKPAAGAAMRGVKLGKPSLLPASGPIQSPSLSPALHPSLLERLLGKSPLRLVVDRTLVEKNVWKEKLECGHAVLAFLEFQWDEHNKLIEFEPHAKRRRCRECKPAVAPKLLTRAEISAARAEAELVHKRKLQFGSLFDKFCFVNGELRPGPTEAELAAWCEGRELPSPKKPVQSVRLADREKKSKGEFCP
jgi:hypothetical protein